MYRATSREGVETRKARTGGAHGCAAAGYRIDAPADQAQRHAQIELMKTMMAAEKEAPRRTGLEARVKLLEDGKADS